MSAPRLQRLPEGLTERVSSELRQFDPTARSLLELLAVVGRPASLKDLGALVGEPPEALEGIVDGLVVARIVAEDERGGVLTYEIHHPLIRDVIYRATSRGRRRALHRRAGRSLRASGHLAEAALHFARAAERGDSEAVDVLLDAMRQAERREAFREALDLQAELVRLLPEDDARWLEVLEAMYTRAEWLIDHRAETQRPLRSGPAGDRRPARGILAVRPSGHGQVPAGQLSRLGYRRFEAAQAACAQAHELFCVAGDERQALLAARELAWIKGLRGHLTAMGEDAEGVVRAAEARGDRFVVMQGLSAVGYSANFRGALAEGEAALRRAVTIAREDEKSYRLTVALGVLAAGLALQGRVSETTALFEEARALNPAYRESILIELETLVAWIGGGVPSAVTMASEAVAWMSGTTARRRTFGMVFGALAAIEVDDVAAGRAAVGARARRARGSRVVVLPAHAALR